MLPPVHERTMVRTINRRSLLQMLGGATLLAAGDPRGAVAQSASKIAPLIEQARALEPISARIAFISRAFIGTRYVGNTLIGGPRQPEQFVVRDDAFDCVTYCEIVLAAALARDYDAFEAALKKIRYANGDVRWDERNHYFAEWCRSAVEKKDLPADRIAEIDDDRQDREFRQFRTAAGFDAVRAVGIVAGAAEPVGERRRHRLRVAPDEPRFLPHRIGDAVREG